MDMFSATILGRGQRSLLRSDESCIDYWTDFLLGNRDRVPLFALAKLEDTSMWGDDSGIYTVPITLTRDAFEKLMSCCTDRIIQLFTDGDLDPLDRARMAMRCLTTRSARVLYHVWSHKELTDWFKCVDMKSLKKTGGESGHSPELVQETAAHIRYAPRCSHICLHSTPHSHATNYLPPI